MIDGPSQRELFNCARHRTRARCVFRASRESPRRSGRLSRARASRHSRRTGVGALAVAFVGGERAIRLLHRLVGMAPEVFRRQSVAGERFGVLGTDDQHRVQARREVLAVHRPAERPGEGPRRAARVMRDSVWRLARRSSLIAARRPKDLAWHHRAASELASSFSLMKYV